jgi:chromosome partitioning protein
MIRKLKKYAVLNNKGGVGKSTLAVHIAHGLALRRYRVLLLDLDEQNDASLFLGFTAEDYRKTFDELLFQRKPLKWAGCIIKARENLDLLPARHIDRINVELYQEPRLDLFLKEKLRDLEESNYDYLIIDCGPQRSKINDAVLYFVEGMILPIQVEAASVRAIGNIYEYLAELRLDTGMISLVVPNLYDRRTSNGREIMEFLKEFFAGTDLLTLPIGRRVKIAAAGKLGKTVYELNDSSAEQFGEVVERLVKRDAR